MMADDPADPERPDVTLPGRDAFLQADLDRLESDPGLAATWATLADAEEAMLLARHLRAQSAETRAESSAVIARARVLLSRLRAAAPKQE